MFFVLHISNAQAQAHPEWKKLRPCILNYLFIFFRSAFTSLDKKKLIIILSSEKLSGI